MQLVILPAQPPDLLALGRRRQIPPLAAIGLVLADLLAQRLGMHPEVVCDMRDRPLALQSETNTAPDQLVGVLLRSGHRVGASLSARTRSRLQGDLTREKWSRGSGMLRQEDCPDATSIQPGGPSPGDRAGAC